MQKLVLSDRLAVAASLVRGGRLTADVGTDHGYLPAFLVLCGKTERAIASDIGKGPLESAEKTVKKYGLEDKISLVLSDGLRNVSKEADEIIIAGMGGTLIVDILSAAPWIKNEKTHLVLQPMTHSYDVRKFLCENGFYIDTEKFCEDDGRIYVVISAFFSGKNEEKDDLYYYFGGKENYNSDFAYKFMQKQKNYIKSRRDGLKHTDCREEYEKFASLLEKSIKEYGGDLL